MDSDGSEPGDVFDLDVTPPDAERRWLVLYDEDYHDVMLDGKDNVGLLLDLDDAAEVFRLASQVLASLSAVEADGDDAIGEMITQLEEVRDDDA